MVKKIAALFVASLGLVLVSIPGQAWAANGTETLNITGGSLSIGTVTNGNISVSLGGSANGAFPSAPWSDTTGTGNGWNGTIAVSDFSYTGAWTLASGTTQTLATTAAGNYSDTVDGVTYTVKVGTGGSGTSTPFTYSSNDPNDTSGSGTATNGSATAVGLEGLTITFTSGTTYSSGDTYYVHVGTESASACILNSASGSITPAAGNTSTPPVFVNSGTTVSGGGATTLGTAIKFVSAAIYTGMGTFTVVPGMNVTTDSSSWAGAYSATVQYTIASGP
jgi:fibronectin-binding autotransporter adhesin